MTDTKPYWRIRRLDQRFLLQSRLNLSVSFELASPYMFADWIDQTEQYLTTTLGPAARLSIAPRWDTQGRWLGSYYDVQHLNHTMLVYRFALRDRKLLDTVLISQGEPRMGLASYNLIDLLESF
jgi:hypothetical protein